MQCPVMVFYNIILFFHNNFLSRGRRGCDRMVVEIQLPVQSLLVLGVQIPLRRGVLDTTLYDNICQ